MISCNDEIGIGGWFPQENRDALESLIRECRVKTVVEVGSFLGLSAVWFARRVEQVTCIDSWHESANYENENNLVGTLRRWELPRDFFHLFRENVLRSGVWHKVLPVRGHSHYVYGEVGLADLVYMDADHSYEGCRRDIEIYSGKARRIICGDDYVEREGFGVIQAVSEAFPAHQHAGNFWWVDVGAERLKSVLGWMLPENRENLTELIARRDVRTVLELGTCYGLSAGWFAQRTERVTCVDVWGAIPGSGVPKNVYDLFLANMKALLVDDRVSVIRGDSHASQVYARAPVADLVYVDGDHTYEGCKRDIEMYGSKALKVLCGDDYDLESEALAGVPRAVDEMLPERQTSGRFWWVEL